MLHSYILSGSELTLLCLYSVFCVHAVIRERYLRSDVPCGIESCPVCAETPTLSLISENAEGNRPRSGRVHKLLPARGCAPAADTRFPGGHFVVLDTNVVLHQLDLIESDVFAFGANRGCGGERGNGDVALILCQTVLEEVRHRSLAVYARVRRLVADEERKVGVFWNELREDTALVGANGGDGSGETVNDRNDRSTFIFLFFLFWHI